jgi:uncharacterized protein (DUF736 family)
MAIIGTFTKTGVNEFTGTISTLTIQLGGVRIIPDTRANSDNAPSHRVMCGATTPSLGGMVQAFDRRPRLSKPQTERSQFPNTDPPLTL